MSWKQWLKFPPRVAILLALATAVPLSALIWLGYRVLEQDRALEEQQIRQRVEQAADIVTAALQRTVAASERRLAEGNSDWPDGGRPAESPPAKGHLHPQGRRATPRLPA